MRRLACIVILLAASCAGPAALAAGDPPRAQLRSFVCQRAMDPASRATSVTAVMRPLPGTVRMAMRFELLRRSHRGAHAAAISARGLGGWIAPTNPPTLGQMPGDVWIVNHPVVELAAPDLYRFRVSFRWTGSGGQPLGAATRLSATCAQPELRPDLVVKAISVRPLAPGSDRYAVLVRNAGRTASGPFAMALSLGDALAGTERVQQLAPRTATLVRLRAPACPAGQPVSVTADTQGQVDDANRANNTLAVPCP